MMFYSYIWPLWLLLLGKAWKLNQTFVYTTTSAKVKNDHSLYKHFYFKVSYMFQLFSKAEMFEGCWKLCHQHSCICIIIRTLQLSLAKLSNISEINKQVSFNVFLEFSKMLLDAFLVRAHLLHPTVPLAPLSSSSPFLFSIMPALLNPSPF